MLETLKLVTMQFVTHIYAYKILSDSYRKMKIIRRSFFHFLYHDVSIYLLILGYICLDTIYLVTCFPMSCLALLPTIVEKFTLCTTSKFCRASTFLALST